MFRGNSNKHCLEIKYRKLRFSLSLDYYVGKVHIDETAGYDSV